MMAAGDGLISMTPTSIAYSGTSASINADGGVDFTAVTSLSLNGVFTGDYDNYLVVLSGTSSGGLRLDCRLRASGSDDSTASSYTIQQLQANGGTVSGSRSSANAGQVANFQATQACGFQFHFYGPALSQPTAERSVSVGDLSSAFIPEFAWTHNQSTAYDGFTVFPTANNITGTVHVFGYEE